MSKAVGGRIVSIQVGGREFRTIGQEIAFRDLEERARPERPKRIGDRFFVRSGACLGGYREVPRRTATITCELLPETEEQRLANARFWDGLRDQINAQRIERLQRKKQRREFRRLAKGSR